MKYIIIVNKAVLFTTKWENPRTHKRKGISWCKGNTGLLALRSRENESRKKK